MGRKTQEEIIEEWGDMMLEEATDSMVDLNIRITPESLSTYFEKHYELALSPEEARDWLESRDWYQEEKGERMEQQHRQASRDQVVMEIHVLWERGWEVNPEAVQEMIETGSPSMRVTCSQKYAEKIIKEVVTPGTKEAWLANFNFESSFAKEHPRPWPISEQFKHQQHEERREN